MRFRWLAVVVLLGAVAMSASIEAQNKRTASMSVRVLVVRPCLVNTAVASGGSQLNCDVPGAPAPRMNTTPFQGTQQGSLNPQPQAPGLGAAAPGSSSPVSPAPAAMTSLSAGTSTGSPVAVVDAAGAIVSTDAAAVTTTSGDVSLVTSPGTPETSRPSPMEGLRVLTVNF